MLLHFGIFLAFLSLVTQIVLGDDILSDTNSLIITNGVQSPFSDKNQVLKDNYWSRDCSSIIVDDSDLNVKFPALSLLDETTTEGISTRPAEGVFVVAFDM